MGYNSSKHSRGMEFEKRVKEELTLSRITVIKVPNQIVKTKTKLFRKKTEFDFCCGVNGIAVFFDCKEYKTKNCFNIKSYVLDPDTIHQWYALLSAGENGNKSGYLVHFKGLKKISWVPSSVMAREIQAQSLSVSPETEGVVSQPDDIAINLRHLLSLL